MSKNELKWKVTADSTGFEKTMGRVLQTTEKVAKGIGVGLTAGAAGVAAAGVMIYNAMEKAGESAQELENLARLAGMGVEEFQNYAIATDRAGISSEKLADISKDVHDKLGDFIATGAGGFKDFFEQVAPQIGLTAKELQGLSGPDVLIAVQDAMDAVNISAEEQVFYLESIASDSALLTPLLRDNGAALKEQAARADELGIALSKVDTQGLIEAQRSIQEIDLVVGSLVNQTLAALAPAFSDITTQIIDGFVLSKGGVDDLANSISIGVIGALDGLVTGIEYAILGWQGMKVAWNGTLSALVGGLASTIDFFNEGWGAIAFSASDTWLDIKFGALLAFDGITEGFAGVIEAIATQAGALSFTIANPFGDDWEVGMSGASASMRGIAGDIRDASTATEDYASEKRKLNDAYHQEVEAGSALANELHLISGFYDEAGQSAYDGMVKTTAAADSVRSALSGIKTKLESIDVQRVASAEVVEQTNTVIIQSDNAVSTNAIAATTASTKAMLSLGESLADKVNKLSLSKYAYAVQKLDDEVAKMQEVAGKNKEIQGQIAEFHKLKLREINTAFHLSKDEITSGYLALKESVTGSSGSMTLNFGAMKTGFAAQTADSLTSKGLIESHYITLNEVVAGDAGVATAMFTALSDGFGATKDTAGLSLLTGEGSIESSFTGLHDSTTGESGSMTALGVDIDGVFDDMQDKADEIINTNPEAMKGKFDTFSTDVQTEIKTGLSATLIEEFGGLNTAWGGVWDSMLSKMAGVLAEMATSWTVSAVGSMFEGWDIFHAGIWNLQDDETPAILQHGEMVIPKEHAAVLRENLGNDYNGDFDGLVDATNNSKVGEWGSVPEDAAIGEALGKGFQERTMDVIGGVFGGQIDPGQAMAHIADPVSMGADFASGVVGAALDAHVPARTGIYGSIGSVTGYGTTVGGLGASPASSIAAPIGARIGNYAMDALGDALDDREFEAMRDMVEDGVMTPSEMEKFSAAASNLAGNDYGGSALGGFVGGIAESIQAAKDYISNVVADAISAMSDHSTGGNDGGGPVGDQSSSGDATGPGHGGTPGLGGYALGGVVNKLAVPDGDQGFAALRLGEGIIDVDTMKVLSAKIRSGNLGRETGEIVEAIKSLEAAIQRIGFAVAKNTQDAAKFLKKFDDIGMEVRA